MNKYYSILHKIVETGKTQTNKKGSIRYLLNEQLQLGDRMPLLRPAKKRRKMYISF